MMMAREVRERGGERERRREEEKCNDVGRE